MREERNERASGGRSGERTAGSRAQGRPAQRTSAGRNASGRLTQGGSAGRNVSGRVTQGGSAGRNASSRVAQGGSAGRNTSGRLTQGGSAGRNTSSRPARRSSTRRNTSTRTSRRKKQMRRRNFVLFGILTAVLVTACLAGYFFLAEKEKIKKEETQKREVEQMLEQVTANVNLDSLDSPYAILLDAETGKVLASKRGDEKIFPASMAKIMTVLTAIESIPDLDKTITMSYDFYEELYAQDASRAGFEPGEEAKLRDLLYGALLPSGAECCMQLAIEVSGSEAAFAERMNEKALDMGLTQTHFMNVTGLHHEEQYSTAHEIGMILQEALKNKTFYQVFTTHSYSVGPTAIHPDGFTFWSTLFKNIQDSIVNGGELMGGKTGFTSEAGHCLASMAEINGRQYILVTAGWAQNPEAGQYHISDAFRAYNQIAPV